MIRTLIALLSIVFFSQTSFSQNADKKFSNNQTHPKAYNTKRVMPPPVIDGLINDKAWDNVNWANDFVQSEPNEGDKPSFDTRFKILYDSDYLYVAIRCYDNAPEKISTPITPRDNFKGDWVDINIDTDLDNKTASSFTIKASGIRGDEYIRKDGWNWDAGWNPNWIGKTNIDSIGWTAEMQIPMNQLNIISGKKQTWGIQVTRKIDRHQERSTWKLIPYETDKWVSLFSELYGIDGVNITPPNIYIPSHKYSTNELREDFQVFRSALENVYPSLYRFSNKESFDNNFNMISSSLDKPMNLTEFYKEIFPVCDKLGDGHLRLNFPDNYLEYSKHNIKKIPFKIQVQDNRAFIIENYSNDRTPIKGTEIISINGKPICKIINSLIELITADGYNKTFKYKYLSNKFGFYYSQYDSSDRIDFEFIAPKSNKTQLIDMDLMFESDIEKNKKLRYNSEGRKEKLSFSIVDNSIAVISIRTFLNDKSLRKFLDKSFHKIDSMELENLIIDLRDNRGGNDYNGAYLYSYLTDKPFKYYERFETQLTPNQKVIPNINFFDSYENLTYLTSIISKDSIGRSVISDFESTYHKNPENYHEPKPNNYKGKVCVLIDGGSFSVTSEFCSILHYNHRAVFVGEETGGGYYGNTSGLRCNLILPNTKIIASLPLIKFVSAVEDSDADFGRGVLPDIEIQSNRYDISNSIDTQMKFTLNWIRMNK